MLQRVRKSLPLIARSRNALFSSSTKIPVKNTGILPQRFMALIDKMDSVEFVQAAEVIQKINNKSKAATLPSFDGRLDDTYAIRAVCEKMQKMPKEDIAYALGVNPDDIESTGFNQFNWFVINFNKPFVNIDYYKECLLDSDLDCFLFKASENSNQSIRCYSDKLPELYDFIVSGGRLEYPERLQIKP